MREIRSSGSVRGVGRQPYPYRDIGSADAVGSDALRDDGAGTEPRAAHVYRACGDPSGEGLGAITLPEFEMPIVFWNPSRPSTRTPHAPRGSSWPGDFE